MPGGTRVNGRAGTAPAAQEIREAESSGGSLREPGRGSAGGPWREQSAEMRGKQASDVANSYYCILQC